MVTADLVGSETSTMPSGRLMARSADSTSVEFLLLTTTVKVNASPPPAVPGPSTEMTTSLLERVDPPNIFHAPYPTATPKKTSAAIRKIFTNDLLFFIGEVTPGDAKSPSLKPSSFQSSSTRGARRDESSCPIGTSWAF